MVIFETCTCWKIIVSYLKLKCNWPFYTFIWQLCPEGTSGNIWRCHTWQGSYWHLVGGGQECHTQPTMLGTQGLSSSVQFSRSVVSNSLQPHEPQHARAPCPSPTPGVYPISCPLSQWWHPTTSSSVVPFSSCPQSFPASGSFQMSQLFVSGGQCIRVSASTSVLPMNNQDWSPLGWTGWIFLQSKRLSRVFSNTTIQKHQFFSTQLSL